MERVMSLASKHAVVIFSKTSCCMCHTVQSLFYDLGVNIVIHELDQEPRGRDIEGALVQLLGPNTAIPTVFIGGMLIGSTERIMSLHLGGDLIPLLRSAGAIWL
ncbi:putative glutaredoxin-C14 [Asparagus officinalis]|uniref:putative glutaredoxin-C14 n=1 Tax=Asparagus officinalis TaxID=4686 RepID=UPI00098E0BB1|nr:putative glutaredoxin-C14 [Asparagus officinalis]